MAVGMLNVEEAYSRIPIYPSKTSNGVWNCRFVYVLPDSDNKNRFAYFPKIPGNGWIIEIDYKPKITPYRIPWVRNT